MGTLEPATVKKLVNHLVPAHRSGDPFFVPAFLSIYRRFATTQQVLDLLFLRWVPPASPGNWPTPGWLLVVPCTILCPLCSVETGVLRGPLRRFSEDQVG